MKNPELTRSRIIETASLLFNSQGYKATSISDITKKAALTKGAIYRHFKDKSALEKEALRYMCNRMLNDITQAIISAKDSKDKLYCIFNYFESYGDKAPFIGGCPLMNAAAEADDNNRELKNVVQYIMSQIHAAVTRVIDNGIQHGQIKKDTDGVSLASYMISSLEGSVMMYKIFDNSKHLRSSINYVKKEIDQIFI